MTTIERIPLHPDDLLFFNEVADVMRRVAVKYELPLLGVEAFPMPATSMADRLGDCSHSGRIRLVMRCTVDGAWCDAPMSPAEVWQTAAHELAHLRYFSHGDDHRAFEHEMEVAIANARGDHRQKVIDKLLKMKASSEGEAKLGNAEAAEAFAAAINRMLVDHELQPSDLEYAKAQEDDPIVELSVDLSTYRIEFKPSRIAWQESLARIVANAHFCRFLVRPRTNIVTFVGTKSHATVAEYAYGTMVRCADRMSREARDAWWRENTGGRHVKSNGFRASWLAGFTDRIDERFSEERTRAVAAAVKVQGISTSTGLMRLNGAMTKAQRYVDDKFIGKASSLAYRSGRSAEGRQSGRAAADAMPIGRTGITTTASRKSLN